MRLLLIGGSFNPPHWGHLLLAEELREEFGYDLVLLVPAARPPHKELADDPGASHRLAMLRLAAAGNPSFEVDDCEVRRSGPSYTIDTLRGLAGRYDFEGKPGFALGDDLVPGFPDWREPEAIAREAELIVARRSGLPVELPFPHRRAVNRLIPLSSSEVRERLAAGRSVRYLLPETVREYVYEKGLYGTR